VLEKPDISKTNSKAKNSQQEGQFDVPRFYFFLNTLRPEHLFTFTRTQITAVATFTGL